MDESVPLWERCEDAWADWLGANGYVVFTTARATGNSPGTMAPMIRAGGRLLRAPDIHTTKQQVTEYWEVKSRGRSDVDDLTGEREHWMELAAFRHYLAVAEATSARVWIVLYEAPTSVSGGRWLRIEARPLRDSGRRGQRLGRSGALVEAWIWPVAAMTVTEGPAVTGDNNAPLMPEEGSGEPIPDIGYDLVVRRGRRRPEETRIRDGGDEERAAEAVLDESPTVGLDFLRRRLGIPALPTYSVLVVAPDPERVEDLLALLDYGIRVFAVSDRPPKAQMDPLRLRAFREARLLEWATVEETVGPQTWVVDGRVPVSAEQQVSHALDLADQTGDFNAQQFRVIHAEPDADVMIVAGAGTGKTETMAERFMFLLATSSLWPAQQGRPPRAALRADQVSFVTFTRDAAAEMRSRIARTLMLRRRLASRCALPVLAWLMQFSAAEVATIHSFAKRTVSRTGGALGVSPGFAVSNMTMDWQRLVDEALSPALEGLFAKFGERVPAAYEWERHLKELWTTLEDNGVDLLNFTGAHPRHVVDWGAMPEGQFDREVTTVMQQVLEEVAAKFRTQCLVRQQIPMDQLVPVAIAGIEASALTSGQVRHLFIDEFQDTDPRQMELFTAVRKKYDARLFIVGDPKQGIYRFRGAAGDAFSQFRRTWEAAENSAFKEYTLTRNFRSGEALLGSFHPTFQEWGRLGQLAYSEKDRLLARAGTVDHSKPIKYIPVRFGHEAASAASQVSEWRDLDPQASIGILCRQNWQALEVREAIRASGGSCDIRVGGDFFRTEAVREARVLLEAIASPSDDAALLELVQTRWAPGILRAEAPMGLNASWGDTDIAVHSWSERLSTLNDEDTIGRQDLTALRRRVVALGERLNMMPVLAWLVECHRVFAPETFERPGVDEESERVRYQRCMDQLITIMDSHFEKSPAGLDSILGWLRLQIATNFNEDEDLDSQASPGRTVALTVHKAKGAEFDYVLLPWTTTPFEPRSYSSRVAVLRESEGGPARLAWDWRPQRGNFTNVAQADDTTWRRDSVETAHEETRLLYVAMTRAKRHLLVYVPNKPTSRTDIWAGLLRRGA